MLKFRWISLLTDPGLNIDATGFDRRRDKGSIRRKAGMISGSGAKNAFDNESGINSHRLKRKKGIEIRNRLNRSLRANSVSFNP